MTAPLRSVDRRTTIKWLAATMTASAGCASTGKFVGEEIPPAANPGDLLLGRARATGGPGYGTDPNLVNPDIPWQRTMTDAQRRLAAALCDVILPADDYSPAASSVGVHEFIDEWVSAPYPQQRRDRELVLEGLESLERRCRERFDEGFSSATTGRQISLVETLASRDASGDIAREAEFFARFRYLAAGAFYTTAAGISDIGYIGNVPISGDYPGPSEEALAHLSGVLQKLGLPPMSA